MAVIVALLCSMFYRVCRYYWKDLQMLGHWIIWELQSTVLHLLERRGGAGLDILLMRSRFDEILMLGHNQGSRLKEKAKIYLFGLP